MGDGSVSIRRDRSIARRLTASLIVAVSLVSAVTVGYIYYKEAQKNKTALSQKADDLIGFQKGVLTTPLWDLDYHSIRMIGNTIFHNELVARVVIKDYSGRVVYSKQKPNLFGSVIRSAPVMHEGDPVGHVEISLTKQFYQENNRQLLNSFLAIIALILVSLILASQLLVRTFLRKPLNRLNTMVQCYASGEYDSVDEYQPYIEFKPFSQVLYHMGRRIMEQIKDLARAEEKYRSIFENAIEGIFQSTPEGRFISVNPSMAEIMGYDSPQDLLSSVTDIGKQCYVSPQEREELFGILNKNDRVLEFEAHMYHKSGRVISASISARTVRDATGGVLYWEGSLVDISVRKKAIEALRETKEQLSMLLESLPIVPFTCEAGGDFRITYVSNAIEEMTGYTSEQFTSEPCFWSERIFEEDRRRILSKLPHLIEEGRIHYEYRFRTAAGHYRYFDDIRHVVRSPDGHISHVAGTWRDITEDKRLRKEAEYRLQEVVMADKLASLGHVAAGVAHEINNPNSFITYNIPLLEETWGLFEPLLAEFAEQNPEWSYRGLSVGELCRDMHEIIESIKTGSDRINRIVTNLKDFVRMDEGLPPTEVNVNEVIEKTFEIVGTQVRKSVAGIEMRLAADLPTIRGSFQKLEQVVANLVVNALQAIPDRSSGRLVISTRHLVEHNAVIIQVEDNGTGMEAEIVDRIFEPFFTLKRGGTGLGLSVSYNLVKEHNGVLAVLSRPAAGSRFTVFLPTQNVKLELRPTVLCVDHDRAFMREFASFFAEVGTLHLVVQEDPAKIAQRLEERPEIDILVGSLETLGLQAWRTLADLKERFPLLTIILYTEHDDTFRQKHPELSGPDHLLIKPFPFATLREIINGIGRQKL
ncbi:MAG: PAS domain S-box protein [Syntrophobacteraceae bacterium]